MPKHSPIDIQLAQKTSTARRVSIGLIAVSISLFTLALGTALFLSPSANYLFVAGTSSSVQLAAAPSTATAVTLTWTAPGDNGNVGQAASYDIRYSSTPMTDQVFASANAVPNPPTPAPAGSTETVTVTGLQPSTLYFFALKTSDVAGNVSALSNIASKTTSALAVACIPTYSCSEWTVCANGTQTRTCPVTNGCSAGLDAPVTTQSCTAPAAPAIGGEPIRVAKNYIVAGLGAGSGPVVRVVDPVKKKAIKEFVAFGSKDRNGVTTAAGDINGDKQADVIVGTGAGTDASVKVFTVAGKLVTTFNPYPTDKKTGVAVATGDVNGDGVDELLTVPAKGLSQIRVWQYNTTTKKFTQLAQTLAFDKNSKQGFTLASGDLDQDGRAEIVIAPRLNGRSIMVLRLDAKNALTSVRRFTTFPISFSTGITVAVGDVLGTGRPVIITTSGPNYYSHIKLFDIRGTELASFLPLAKSFRDGLSLAALDVNGDGRDEILVSGYARSDAGVTMYRYNGLKKTFEKFQSYSIFPRQVKIGLRLSAT